MLGPFATASRRTPHCHSPDVTACASMSTTTTTTTTTTTRDRGDRYGPIEWAQKRQVFEKTKPLSVFFRRRITLGSGVIGIRGLTAGSVPSEARPIRKKDGYEMQFGRRRQAVTGERWRSSVLAGLHGSVRDGARWPNRGQPPSMTQTSR